MPARPCSRRRPARPFTRAFSFLLLASLGLTAPELAADDGDLDATFADAGQTDLGQGSVGSVLALRDGAIRVGYWNADAGVIALTAQGELDTTFGAGGRRTIPYNVGGIDRLVAVLERLDGRLVVVLRGDDDFDRTPVLARLTVDGDLDTTFSGDGMQELFFDSSWSVLVLAAAIQNDGKIVIAGRCFGCLSSGETDSFVARYLSTGASDTTFGDTGKVIFDAVEWTTDYDYATSVMVDPDGRIVVGGESQSAGLARPYVARRLSNGDPDPDFAGTDGIRTLTGAPEQRVTALAYDPIARRIVAATSAGTALSPDFAGLARLTDSGVVDIFFSGDGIVPLLPSGNTYVSQVVVQSDRRIVAVGANDPPGTQVSSFFLARVTSSGAIDSSFSDDGFQFLEFDLDTGGRDEARAAVLVGGRVVAAGSAVDGGFSQVAVLRTDSALILADGFEPGNSYTWATP